MMQSKSTSAEELVDVSCLGEVVCFDEKFGRDPDERTQKRGTTNFDFGL